MDRVRGREGEISGPLTFVLWLPHLVRGGEAPGEVPGEAPVVERLPVETCIQLESLFH